MKTLIKHYMNHTLHPDRPRTGFSGFRSVAFAFLAVLASLLIGHSARAQVIDDFEGGTLAGWNVLTSGPNINWFNYTNSAPLSGGIVAGGPQLPPEGQRAAICDSNYFGWAILYRDIVLPAGMTHMLKMQVYYDNYYGGGPLDVPINSNFWLTSAALQDIAYPVKNQQFRVDVLKAGANPASTAPADIIQTVVRPVTGDDASSEPTQYCVDLSAYAGQTVRLRLAVAQNQQVLRGYVDNVRLSSVVVAPPGERVRLQDVQSDLEGILAPVTQSDDRKKLNEAIKKLGEADTDKYWDAADHPTRDDGNKVFDKSKDGSNKLKELYFGAKTVSLRPQVLAPMTEWVSTAKAIATREMNNLATVGPGSKDPNEALKKLNEANEELAKGDEEWAKTKPREAIDHYKHAWEKAIDKVYDISKE